MSDPKECPYCKSSVNLADSALVYHGRSYGSVWICSQFPNCDAYVGCHKGTTKPLGRLANKELRDAKMEAHKYFDSMWYRRIAISKCGKRAARMRGYYWLSQKLGIHKSECHIGMMDLETCRRVVQICKPYAEIKS